MTNFKKISESPTNPKQIKTTKEFDIADLYKGPVGEAESQKSAESGLDEKLRQAYFWIVNHAIISPYYDIEYNEGPNQTYLFGDSKSRVVLPSGQSYSSFILLPLLNLAVRRRCLFVGGPGRGKTASAVLMGILGGYSLKEIKRSIQHGQPQMTITDLLGNPLPSDMINAKNMDDIHIAWRKWLSMRVKIIDEYNRIPTRTQSALLTVLGDNYAELLDQIYECPEASWYLTANDDVGGGTYQVIEALRDRIDIIVQALHFNTRFLKDLLYRIENHIQPEEVVPVQIIFSEQEIDATGKAIRKIILSPDLLRRIEFFASHFELFENAAEQVEYKTKDTVKLSGIDYKLVALQETGKDKLKDLGSQTKNGLSVRSLMTSLIYVKAMAYFRGDTEVSFEDVRQIIPFVLHDKLIQNPDSPFFEQPGNNVYRVDHVSWLRKLFDLSCAEFDRLELDKNDPLTELDKIFNLGLDGVSENEARSQMTKIEHILSEWSKGRKLYGHMYDDILKLKYYHQRYTNYLRWLKWKN
jgi:MoxR-like ATPase